AAQAVAQRHVRRERSELGAAHPLAPAADVGIDPGDPIGLGQAALEALDAASQRLSLASSTWKRMKALYERQAVSLQSLDEAEISMKVARAEYERALASVREARAYLDYTRITAPFAGV
ncbi:MAG TPA: hypothetical protein PLT69_10400, partial [Deltaproteobacteria bacterium]|nr:hypothetical protein [Deltaproteobacteria bacterium]